MQRLRSRVASLGQKRLADPAVDNLQYAKSSNAMSFREKVGLPI
jgi:hypothetical protein